MHKFGVLEWEKKFACSFGMKIRIQIRIRETMWGLRDLNYNS